MSAAIDNDKKNLGNAQLRLLKVIEALSGHEVFGIRLEGSGAGGQGLRPDGAARPADAAGGRLGDAGRANAGVLRPPDPDRPRTSRMASTPRVAR